MSDVITAAELAELRELIAAQPQPMAGYCGAWTHTEWMAVHDLFAATRNALPRLLGTVELLARWYADLAEDEAVDFNHGHSDRNDKRLATVHALRKGRRNDN
jgi:hypothetical protein